MSDEENSTYTYYDDQEQIDYSQSTIAGQDAEMNSYSRTTYSNPHLTNTVKGKHRGFWDKTATAVKKFTYASTLSEAIDTQVGRLAKVPSYNYGALTEGLPERFHTDVFTEFEKYGAVAAITERDRIIDRLATNKQFDDMEWYAQFGYGALALVTDPVNILGSAAIFKGASMAQKAFKGAQQASIINAGVNGGRAWLASGLVANPAKVSGWAAIGAAEGVLTNAPQMASDPTYTAADYMLDIAFDSVLTLGIVGAVNLKSLPATPSYQEQQDEAYRKLQESIQQKIDPPEPVTLGSLWTAEQRARIHSVGSRLFQLKPSQVMAEEQKERLSKIGARIDSLLTSTNEAQKVDVAVDVKPDVDVAPRKIKDVVADLDKLRMEATDTDTQDVDIARSKKLTQLRKEYDLLVEEAKKDLLVNPAMTKYATLDEVSRISTSGFNKVASLIRNRFDSRSSIHTLVNRQQKLLRNKDLSPEVKLEAEKLNADIVRLLEVLPEGMPPQWLEQAIRESTHNQKEFSYTNLLEGIVADGVSEPAKVLREYVEHLKTLDIWEGYKPIPMDTNTFFRENSAWLSTDAIDDDALDFMQAYVSPELSYLRDVVNLNNYAKGVPELKELVEELNGLVMTRLEQKEYSKVTLNSADFKHIADQVREHLISIGYVPKTREFANRYQEMVVEEIAKLRKRVEQPMPEWKDSRESWGKQVRATPEDVRKQLAREGYVKGTPEYKAKFAELIRATKSVPVPEEVNRMGKRKSFIIGTERTDTLDRDEILSKRGQYDGGDDVATGGEGTNSAITERTLDLVVDEPEAELLPRGFNRTNTVSAYDNPTLENIKRLRKVLESNTTRKAKQLIKAGKRSELDNNRRMAAIVKNMATQPKVVIARAMQSGDLQNILDVIKAAQTLARNQQSVMNSPEVVKATKLLEETKPATPEGKKPEKVEEPKPLTEERVELLNPIIINKENVPAEEIALIERDVLRGSAEADRDAAENVAEAINDFVASGKDNTYQEGMKPKHTLDRLGRLLASWTKDLGETFLTSNLTSLRYVGATLLETGAGFGGGVRREGTAALIRDMEYKKSISPMIIGYRDALEKFAGEQGAGVIGKLHALESAGINSGITDKFNREVFKEIEHRKQGKPSDAPQSVKDFVDTWTKYMDYNHNKLVESRIKGFTKERKVEHYMPHVWQYNKLAGAIKTHGLKKVHEVLTQGYMTSARASDLKWELKEAQDQAWELIQWIEGQGALNKKGMAGEDQYLPVLDSRARSRMEINTLAEIDGLTVMDMLETDVMGNGMRYSNRLAGWVGIAKSTNYKITSYRDIRALREHIVEEAKEKGADDKKLGQLYDDSIEMLFGRPTRGGLAPELRMLKDMTALTRMGGLGTAQLIESGQVITRSVLNLFSDPATVSKVRKLAQTPVSESELLQEIQSISGIRDDLEFLERQSVHLDQEDLMHVSEVRKASLWVADKATLGGLKAPASRLLGKTTGYNMIRRYQSRLNQASFAMDVANHFKRGTGKMGNARMADLGLTDVNGKDADLQDVFDNIVEYNADGTVKKLNVDRWPEAARDKFSIALLRDDAQNIQRTHVGELPPWMNSPLMGLLFQFREMPMVAMNKALRRSMAFADKEAVVATMMNAAFAGLVRWAKFAVLGYTAAKITDSTWQEPTQEQMDTAKYITQFGLYADAYDLILDGYTAHENNDVDKMLNQVPVLGLMQDYIDATGLTELERRTQLDAVQGLTPLGNTAYGDAIFLWMNEQFKE